MIRCTNIKCKYRNNKGQCTRKNIKLYYWYLGSVNTENKDYLECKSFKYDKEYLRLKKEMEKLLGDKENRGE